MKRTIISIICGGLYLLAFLGMCWIIDKLRGDCVNIWWNDIVTWGTVSAVWAVLAGIEPYKQIDRLWNKIKSLKK